MNEADQDRKKETDSRGREMEVADQDLRMESGETIGEQHKNVQNAQKEAVFAPDHKWTLEASRKATKSPPSAESLRKFLEGLRERAYRSSPNTNKQEASKFVRVLQNEAEISSEIMNGVVAFMKPATAWGEGCC